MNTTTAGTYTREAFSHVWLNVRSLPLGHPHIQANTDVMAALLEAAHAEALELNSKIHHGSECVYCAETFSPSLASEPHTFTRRTEDEEAAHLEYCTCPAEDVAEGRHDYTT